MHGAGLRNIGSAADSLQEKKKKAAIVCKRKEENLWLCDSQSVHKVTVSEYYSENVKPHARM